MTKKAIEVLIKQRNVRGYSTIDIERIRQREINRINEQRKQEALEKHSAKMKLAIAHGKKEIDPRIKWETIE